MHLRHLRHVQAIPRSSGVTAAGTLQFNSVYSLASTLDEAAVWDLLTSQDIGIAEHQLLHLVKTWCTRNNAQLFQHMTMHIDFGLLTHQQVRMLQACCSWLQAPALLSLHTCR